MLLLRARVAAWVARLPSKVTHGGFKTASFRGSIGGSCSSHVELRAYSVASLDTLLDRHVF